jgi:hypothetical protein
MAGVETLIVADHELHALLLAGLDHGPALGGGRGHTNEFSASITM